MLARNPARHSMTPRRSPPLPGARPLPLTTHDSPHTFRRAFTLIELLAAVIIIAILVGLLLPAILNARIKVQEAKVVSEINQLESAIAAFKVKYGVEPPSQIQLFKTQAGWDSDSRSKGIIKRMWPQFDFAMTGGPGAAYPTAWGAANNTAITPNSGECLMFFLGGIIPSGGGAPTGFAKNPALPFSETNTAREKPFLEFDLNRIRDFDGNNLPEYYDSLPGQTKPYLYFSSYEGSGYRVAELPSGAGFTLVDIYRTNATTVTPGSGAGNSQTKAPQKPQTFQIISPGYDHDYGLGGVFNPALASAGLQNKGDYDNLTNFNGGRLNP